MVLRSFAQLAGGVVWATLIVLRFIQKQFIHPLAEWWLESVLGTYEESLKSVIREAFSNLTRFLNGFFASVVALFVDKEYANTLQTNYSRTAAWQSWWGENKQSTFNALIRRDQGRRSSDGRQGATAAPPAQHASTDRTVAAHASWKWWRPASKTPKWEDQPDSRAATTGFFGRWFGGGKSRQKAPILRRSASDLFDRPSGWAVDEKTKRRGFLEDIRMGCELGVTSVFEAVRLVVRRVLALPSRSSWTPTPRTPTARRRTRSEDPGIFTEAASWEDMASRPRPTRFRRSNSFSSWESLQSVSTAGDVIRQAGYPLEEHTVTTSDGYVLQMERMPRRDARDCVFFMHGILDTSMGWVSNGVTGSQAFAAYDQGFDVWLGNSRSNPPRVHIDSARMGSTYWHYTVNELGMEDVAAQIDHLHVVKCSELRGGAAGLVAGPLAHGFQRQAAADAALSKANLPFGRSISGMRASASDTALDKLDATSISAQRYLSPNDPRGAVAMGPTGRYSTAFPATPPRRRSATRATSQPPATIPDQRIRAAAARPAMSARLPEEKLLVPTKAVPPLKAHSPMQNGHHPPPSVPSHPLPPAPESDVESAGFASPRGVMSPFASPPCGSDDGGGSSAGYITPPEALSPPSRNSCSPNGKRHSADSFLVQRSPASLPTFSSPGARTPAEILMLETEALKQSLEDLQPSTSGRSPATPTKGGPKASPAKKEAGLQRLSEVMEMGHDLNMDGAKAKMAQQLEQGDSMLTPDVSSSKGVERQGELPANLTSAQKRHAHTKPFLEARRRDRRVHMMEHSGGVPEPYRLRAVAHSLGGASLLVYAVMCRRLGRPHHLYRIILLTPAGFLEKIPLVAYPFLWSTPWVLWLLARLRPGTGAAVLIPSSLLRYLTFKLTWDLQQIPALHELARAALRLLLNGDTSQSGRFQLYDFGSAAANRAHYGSAEPPDIAANYGRLDIPVDIMAGRSDGVIARENVVKHYDCMHSAGCDVTYKEFESFGHLDFVFAVKDDLRHYVLSRLLMRH
ncbi:hypothetical protein COCSUDRAFT_39557 [Coccomyxa subellipsoidea C-169]|uniref:Partial AB-hydrolase lipase domain-containing protein n=1 Tax=Coccomyxa subellipsoidea (strain C-169) TaxID=574566 RepID=I0Z748_COCSC|nr:hypothetical protein COCSUDRAFT_39557 [Coccomyxa subellipsoidea C-169]EIE26467.1 hypothetical protein COCSUDRAFT_39557 [Coccomyxa subellipsoidea C-169]|eukprot:XP_005651011.1 hypothetical protein COCSUDRAFT_39557 [Coccomyxa subellipsoidea C-169]